MLFSSYLHRFQGVTAIVLPLLTIASVLTLRAEAAESLEMQWQDLCSYDREWCGRLKNGDGSFIKPKKEIVVLLKTLQPEIQAAAKDYDIDSRAIAGAILAENSLNVQISDSIQDFLVKYKIAPKGEVFGKAFSFGLGQLHADVAQESEALAAKIEKRSPRSPSEISTELLKPAGAIRYVAAVLRRTQDIYKSAGYDVSKKPEILATLYNIGKPEERSKRTKTESREPKVNYFGFFVAEHLSNIEEVVGYQPDVSKTVVASAQSVAPTAVRKQNAQEKSDKAVKSAAADESPKVLREVVNQPLQLFLSPPSCQTQGAGHNGEYLQYSSMSHYRSIGTIKSGTSVKIISPGLGCGLEDWSLIRAGDGTIGWAKTEQLTNVIEKRLVAEEECPPEEDVKHCERELSKVEGATFVNRTDQGATLRLAGGRFVDWKYPDLYCLNNQMTQSVGVANGAIPAAAPSIVPAPSTGAKQTMPTKEKLQADLKAIEDRMAELFKQLNASRRKEGLPALEKWTVLDNPYIGIEWVINQAVSSLRICISRYSNEVKCTGDSTRVLKLLSFEPKARPSYSELKTMMGDGQSFYSSSYSLVVVDSDEMRQRRKIREELKPCEKFAANLPNSADYLSKIVLALEDENSLLQSLFPSYQTQGYTPPSPLVSAAKLGEECRFIASVFAPTATRRPDSDSISPCSPLSEDELRNILGRNIGLDSRDIRSVVNAALPTLVDRDAFLKDRLEWQLPMHYFTKTPRPAPIPSASPSLGSSAVPQGYLSQSQNCGYMPFKTVELIEEMLKSGCVEAVYVPDPWLVKRFQEETDKVLFRPFEEVDRFWVQYKGTGCRNGDGR